MATSTLHDQLVKRGAGWMRRNGFGVVETEIRIAPNITQEEPDVIAFRQGPCAIIEVKVSRSDFLADAKKPWRDPSKPSLGTYRFYLCPVGIIEVSDLPPGWGLLHAKGRSIIEVVRPMGNAWPDYGDADWAPHWIPFQHKPDLEAERGVLYSIARRQQLGKRRIVSGTAKPQLIG